MCTATITISNPRAIRVARAAPSTPRAGAPSLPKISTPAGDDSLSHIPYNLFVNGTAVCDGYTGAYNLLLKLEGIDCTALSNDSHIWTVATLDGVQVHIDTTWGDSGSAISYTYFAMTPEQSWRFHSW